MTDINKDIDIGIKVAATEMEVIMVDMGVIEVNGAIENSEVIIAKVDIAENRVEVMAAANIIIICMHTENNNHIDFSHL
jgi:hypothetical protein